MAHMKYGGSTIALTELCSASNAARLSLGDYAAGPAADRGARIHKMAELMWLEAQGQTVDYQSCMAKRDEMAIAAKVIESMQSLVVNLGMSNVGVERSYTLHEIHPEAGGTADQDGYTLFSDAMIVDLKTGRNKVTAQNNMQLAFYALGLLQSLDPFTRATINNVHMIILQPEQEEPYYVHEEIWTQPAFMLETYWRSRIADAIENAETNPTFTAGDHCEDKYCNFRTHCQAYQDWLNERSCGMLQEIIDGADPLTLKPKGQRLSLLLAVAPRLKALISAAEKDAANMLAVDPDAVPNWTLADSYGNRKWTDTKALDELSKALGIKNDDYRPRAPITPAAYERLGQKAGHKLADVKKMIEPLTDREYNGKRLVQDDGSNQSTGEKLYDAVNNNQGA